MREKVFDKFIAHSQLPSPRQGPDDPRLKRQQQVVDGGDLIYCLLPHDTRCISSLLEQDRQAVIRDELCRDAVQAGVCMSACKLTCWFYVIIPPCLTYCKPIHRCLARCSRWGWGRTGQLVADVLNSQHAGTGATWRINVKILSTCRGGGILCRHAHSLLILRYYAPPLGPGALSNNARLTSVWRLTDGWRVWRLSVAYIGPSREQRPIGTLKLAQR